jgi:hypothetical protein
MFQYNKYNFIEEEMTKIKMQLSSELWIYGTQCAF